MKFRFLALTGAIAFAAYCNAQTVVVQTFSFTGSTQTFVIPPCTGVLSFSVRGAKGGSTPSPGWAGGDGGSCTVALTPTPGVALYFYIGGSGTSTTGGWNGGGNGGVGLFTNGAGGGGATDIRLGGHALSDRIVVAGGGGGASTGSASARGGDGGGIFGNVCLTPKGATGSDGFSINSGANYASCSGNTLTGTDTGGGGAGLSGPGGASGSGNGSFGQAGALGTGGNGGDSCRTYGGNLIGHFGGGGGGGGYFGGAGGMGIYFDFMNLPTGAGGGGGSTYVDTTKFLSHALTGMGFGQGEIIVSYTQSGSAVSISASSYTTCGNTVTLTGSGASSYTWNTPAGQIISPTVAVTPGTSTAYTLSGTSGGGCISQTMVTIQTSNSSLSVSASPRDSVCAGTQITLNASGAATYTWSSGISNGMPFTPTATSVYTVNADINGCSGTQTAAIFVRSATLAVSGNANLCEGDSLVLSAAGADPGSYLWNGAVQSHSLLVKPTSTQSYMISANASAGSLNCPLTRSVTVQVYPAPQLSVSAGSSTRCLNDAPVTINVAGALTYTWTYPDNSTKVSISGIAVSPSVTSTYSVTGVAASQCKGSSQITISVDACVGLQENPSAKTIVFPNPADDLICLQNSQPGDRFVLINGNGHVVREISIQEKNGKLNVSDLAEGLYLLAPKKAGISEAIRIVILH